MRTRIVLILAVCFYAWTGLQGQSDKKSSGVVHLKMSKKKVEEPVEKPVEKNVSSTTFRMTKPIKKQTQPPSQSTAKVSAPGTDKVDWVSPTLNSINTSKSNYDIQATIYSEEDLRVVNIFINGTFVKNFIMDGSSSRTKVFIRETFDLSLGNNSIKLEAVTMSGKKIEDIVRINYDLSSARYYALIIAVEDYDDPTINDLSEPINDANKFYKIISSRYTFNEEDIIYLKNPTKADIIGTLHKMRGTITEEDNLMIYYAGHGHWDEEMETGYWLPSDANSENPVNWIPNTDLTNYINVLKSKHTLLVADACFSGGIFKTRKAFNNSGAIENLYKLPSRKAITSGNLKEVPDQSVFIEYLLKQLNENNVEYFSSEQLFSQMRPAIMNNSDNVPQYGTIQKVGDEGGDFVFILRD
jgi:hypothetical protein